MIFHRVFPIFIVTIFLFACSESEIYQSEEAVIDQLVTLGEAAYTIEELESAALNDRATNEGCFIYHADDRHDDVNSTTSFLNTQIKSNGKTAFFSLYEKGKLYYSFLDETGITDKLLFEGEMYHSGMINDGLIISKALEQDQRGAFSQISIISNNGEEERYLDRNSGSYFRFTSGPENHTMAIDSLFHLYLFQYDQSTMKRTKITIDPDIDAQGTEQFYVGDNNYLVTSTFGDDTVKLHLIHIEN